MKQQSCKLGSATLIVVFFGSALTATAGSLTPPTGPIQPTNRVQINQQIGSPPFIIDQFGDLPIIIGQSGSYVLTGNIVAPAGHTSHGIVIAGGVEDVTLDLNGFSVIGVAGSAVGIRSFGNFTTVRNGTVRGWGFSGVDLSGDGGHLVDNVRAINNGSNGIIAIGGSATLVEGGSITRCFASNNVNSGIVVGHGMTISHCTANENGGDGFLLFAGQNTIIDCVASKNADYGIRVGFGSDGDTIKRNICYLNGSSSRGQEAGGIFVLGNSLIEGNRLLGNQPFGIEVIGPDSTIIKNIVTGSTSNYFIFGGNDVGPIGSAATSTSPWANISN